VDDVVRNENHIISHMIVVDLLSFRFVDYFSFSFAFSCNFQSFVLYILVELSLYF
jgi:hypothetical protein